MIARLQGVLIAVPLLLAAVAQADPPDPHSWPNRGRLGMEVQSMTDALREYFEAPADRGVLVVRVVPERAAAQAGIKVGDVLTAAAGNPIGEPLDLIAAVARVPAGEKLALEVVRKGKTETVEVAPEGEAIEFTRPEHGAGNLHDDGKHALDGGAHEILRRLDAIEHRLEQMEHELKPTPPGQDHT